MQFLVAVRCNGAMKEFIGADALHDMQVDSATMDLEQIMPLSRKI
ncbi:MAG: hypothetical protein V7L31_24325 [Nostoc sp.]